MIETALALVVGAVAGWVIANRANGSFAVEPLMRTNYRGVGLPTAAGVLIPVTVIGLVAAERLVARAAERAPQWEALIAPTFIAVLAFSLLGLLDDVAGVGQSGGFRGHVAELRSGRLSSGMVKLLGGAATGLLVVASGPLGTGGLASLLRDGAIVALAANLANLFDRAPGRVVKVTTVAFVVAAAIARAPALAVPAAGIGAGLGLLGGDLRERYMLGDAGSNPLGALCGIAALVAAPSATGRWVVLAVLVGANALSEVVSFSRVIDAVTPLRWLDRLGSVRPG